MAADRPETVPAVSGSQTARTRPSAERADRPADSAPDRPAHGQQAGDTAASGALDYIAPSLRALAVPRSSLRPAPDNARRHGDRDLAALCESLQRFGQRKPVVVCRTYRGVAGVVIAGSGTLTAGRHLGWSHLAVAWFEGSEDEARAYAISDNRTAELSEWDAGQLAALQADGVDLLALWGDDAALGDLLQQHAPTPRFEPLPADETHRLDQLAPVLCPHCGRDIREAT